MLILLLLIPFSISILLWADQGDDFCLRVGFIKSAILFTGLITLTTELLSLGQALNTGNIVVFWSLASLTCIILLFRRSGKIKNNRPILPSDLAQLQQARRASKPRDRNRNTINQIAWAGIVITLIICLVTALIAPPNNFDSMTYHMPRVMHWIQNQSVNHYPTHNMRQLFLFPGSSYIVVHFQLLVHSDRFANSVQWLAFLGCILGTSLIVEKENSLTQTMTALVCGSIPMALMQSTTTQNDLLTGFWLVCLSYFVLCRRDYKKTDLLWISTTLGLALLSKPTGGIFAAPILMIFLVRVLKIALPASPVQALIKVLIEFGWILSLPLLLLLPHLYRNYLAFSTFLEPKSWGIAHTNSEFGLGLLISNLLRNIALNVPFSQFWFWVEWFHQILLRIPSNLSTITFGGASFLDYGPSAPLLLIPSEDSAGSPFHLLLFLITLLVLSLKLIGSRKISSNLYIYELGIAIVLGFLSYCLLIKWQIWGNRLMLPLFILASPIMGYAITQNLSKSMQKLIVLSLVVVAVFYSLTPIYHPLVPLPGSWQIPYQSKSILKLSRQQIYFSAHGQDFQPIHAALANRLQQDNCNVIGIDVDLNFPEYYLWTLPTPQGLLPLRVKNIEVQNESKSLEQEFPDSELCALIVENQNKLNYIPVN
jgi:hypothetical protein